MPAMIHKAATVWWATRCPLMVVCRMSTSLGVGVTM
jgi:hypothetical protein